jgi:hypothetical protein
MATSACRRMGMGRQVEAKVAEVDLYAVIVVMADVQLHRGHQAEDQGKYNNKG